MATGYLSDDDMTSSMDRKSVPGSPQCYKGDLAYIPLSTSLLRPLPG
jgi:hypothetical protein